MPLIHRGARNGFSQVLAIQPGSQKHEPRLQTPLTDKFTVVGAYAAPAVGLIT